MRNLLHTILQALIDAEAEAHIGARPHERSEERLTQRNGTRAKMVSTTAGDLSVKIPKTGRGRPSHRCCIRGSTRTRWPPPGSWHRVK